MATVLDSDELAARYRRRIVRHDTHEILIARLEGSEQEEDLSVPPNCGGIGRIRHFRRTSQGGAWGDNPLPIEPALRALGLESASTLRAQAFQDAACNWRCWYCFVPFDLLAAKETRSVWITPDEMVAMFAKLSDRPAVIDLTGGQPDLVPEWVPWTMAALENQGLSDQVYLWSDDNLSNDYFFRFLTARDIDRILNWKNYGRVGCFKGYDPESFAFNTSADPALFDRQFQVFSRLLETGIDLYAYVTLTAARTSDVAGKMRIFVDRLQAIHPNLPLRTIPLRVQIFKPVKRRIRELQEMAIRNQEYAIEEFRRQIESRFPPELREASVCDVRIGRLAPTP